MENRFTNLPPKGGSYWISRLPPKGGSYRISRLPPKGGSYRISRGSFQISGGSFQISCGSFQMSSRRRPSTPSLVASAFRRKISAFAIVGVIGVGLSAQAPADRAQTEALAKRAADRLAALQRESESLATQERGLLAELRKLEVDRAIKVAQLEQIDREATDVQIKLGSAATRAEALQGEAQRQRPDVEARMVQLYKIGRAGYWRLLLDVDSLGDVGRAYRTAAALGRIDRDRVEEHRQTLAALTKERATLETRAADLHKLERKAVDATAALERAVRARSNLVASIDSRRDLNAQLTGELQEAQRKVQATLEQVAAGRTAAPAALPIRPFQRALPWPADGVLSARFGPKVPGTAGPLMRNGIELSLPEGRPVTAVHEGTVAFAEPFSGFGILVIIDHGDQIYTLYGHLGSAAVNKGERVEAGATVGLAGRNPSGNPSLYFEVRVDGQAVNPLQWLKR
jgi:murein hydrolase activator